MRQGESYIPRTHRIAKGGRTDEDSRMDPQVPVVAGGDGGAGVGVAGGRGRLAARLSGEGSGGSGGPPGPDTSPDTTPRSAPSRGPNGTRLVFPGERRVYRVGGSLFRVWVDRPDAGAELYNAGAWVWTFIPSGAILMHPRARALTAEEAEQLRLEGEGRTSRATR